MTRIGVFGPGNVGKTSYLLKLCKYFRNQGKRVILVDSDQNQSLTKAIENQYGAVPNQFLVLEETRNEIRNWLTSESQNTTSADVVRSDFQHRYLLPEDYTLHIFSFFPDNCYNDTSCAHGRLNAVQAWLATLHLAEDEVMLIDHEGGLNALTWPWSSIYLDLAVFLFRKNNEKHCEELLGYEKLAQSYKLPSRSLPVISPFIWGSGVRILRNKVISIPKLPQIDTLGRRSRIKTADLV
jgi:hypothetical protein